MAFCYEVSYGADICDDAIEERQEMVALNPNRRTPPPIPLPPILLPSEFANHPDPSKRSGILCVAAWKWFKRNPLKNWRFAFFFLFSASSLILFVLRGPSRMTADVLAGVLAVSLAIYGAAHFRLILGLHSEVHALRNNNARFMSENNKIRHQIDKLRRGRRELAEMERDLDRATEHYLVNIEKFKHFSRRLKRFSECSIGGIQKIKKLSAVAMDQINNELLQHERDILMKVLDSVVVHDEGDGLTESEYGDFVNALPKCFQKTFKMMNKPFVEICGEDGLLSWDSFNALADRFAIERVRAESQRYLTRHSLLNRESLLAQQGPQ